MGKGRAKKEEKVRKGHGIKGIAKEINSREI